MRAGRGRSGSGARPAARAGRGGAPGGLVLRRWGGGAAGTAARNRLDDGGPEALDPGGMDEGGGAAMERGELLVADEAEPYDPRIVEAGLLAPAGGADHSEPQVVALEPPERVDEDAEVLPRLERRHAEHVRPAELRLLA